MRATTSSRDFNERIRRKKSGKKRGRKAGYLRSTPYFFFFFFLAGFGILRFTSKRLKQANLKKSRIRAFILKDNRFIEGLGLVNIFEAVK